MNRKNRYCCLFIPYNISEKCNYFELDLQVKNLKIMVNDVNKELKSNFKLSSIVIDEKYGIMLFDDNKYQNEYVNKLSNIQLNGKCLLISHTANFDNFIKSFNLNLYNEDVLKIISHNSITCRKMLLLCIKFIKSKYENEL